MTTTHKFPSQPHTEEESAEEESDEEESEEEEETERKGSFQGELAVDMFIDPFNPLGKAAHPTLKSKGGFPTSVYALASFDSDYNYSVHMKGVDPRLTGPD